MGDKNNNNKNNGSTADTAGADGNNDGGEEAAVVLPQPLASDEALEVYTSTLKVAVADAMARLQRMNDGIRALLRVYKQRQDKVATQTHHARQRQSELQGQMQALLGPYAGILQSRIADVVANCRARFSRLHDACTRYLNETDADAAVPAGNP